MNYRLFIALLVVIAMLPACKQQDPTAGEDMARLQQAMLAKQALLLDIHLDLDSAAREISDAQITAEEGNCSAAEFHATEAYRKLRDADEAILELGTELQALFNLDSIKTKL